MEKKKVLIIGNHTCANRGDAAILRGLICSLRREFPGHSFEIMSRHVMAGLFILKQEMIEDFVYRENNRNRGLIRRIKKRFTLELLLYSLVFPIFRKIIPALLSRAQAQYCNLVKDFSAVIQVGGSFFVDLYGIGQYENLLLSMFIGKDVHLIGHSLGPFERNRFRRFSKIIFPRLREIKIRDTESLRLIREAGLFSENISYGADTAWLIEYGPVFEFSNEFTSLIEKKRKIVAITLRELFPFDKRLGINQKQYEGFFIQVLERLIEEGFEIACVSMCTGLDKYNKDDRMVGLKIKHQLTRPERMTVLMNEYTDLEIGAILSRCELLIGTRLHSVILSLLFHTPVIAILYEHKSKGLLDKLGLGEFSFFIQDMTREDFYDKIADMLQRREYFQNDLNKKVSAEVGEAAQMIQSIYFRESIASEKQR